MNKPRKTTAAVSILYFITAALNAVVAILRFSHGDTSEGVVYLALCATFLSLGAFYLGRGRRGEKQE